MSLPLQLFWILVGEIFDLLCIVAGGIFLSPAGLLYSCAVQNLSAFRELGKHVRSKWHDVRSSVIGLYNYFLMRFLLHQAISCLREIASTPPDIALQAITRWKWRTRDYSDNNPLINAFRTDMLQLEEAIRTQQRIKEGA